MWPKAYRDYKKDEPLVKHTVCPGRGIVGCEMHELNGWGEEWHTPSKRGKKKGLIRTLMESFFGLFTKRTKL